MEKLNNKKLVYAVFGEYMHNFDDILNLPTGCHCIDVCEVLQSDNWEFFRWETKDIHTKFQIEARYLKNFQNPLFNAGNWLKLIAFF